MIKIEIDKLQFDLLSSAVDSAGKSLRKELAAAVNATKKDTDLQIARDIGSVIKMSIKDIKKKIRSGGQATAESPQAYVALGWSKRSGIEYFGAKHNKKGVSYQVSKQGGRTTIAGAFRGPKPGVIAPALHGGVYLRMGPKRKMTKGRRQGKTEQPIVRLFGVSPAGAYLKNDFSEVLPVFIAEKLSKQLERRINLNVLRANGLVNN